MRIIRLLLAVILTSFLAFAQQPAAPEKPKARTQKPAEEKKKTTTAPVPTDKDKPKDADADKKEKPEEKPADPLTSSSTYGALRLRNIGPGTYSGRVTSFAVNPKNRRQYYAGVASGGVWKTENAGITWKPVFDTQGSYSIGWVALDPKNPAVVWVGTGENNSQRSVSYGDGVYKSEDGGKSWKNVGLKKSEHIGRIVIDPRDSNVVYVAAQGPLWGPGGDRGLYKTSDGGKTWDKVLNISENTGVTDVVFDPENPDVLIAAAWQRRRHVYTMIDGGPEGGLHRSTDGGKTWTKLTSGLPSVDIGRIGIAWSPADPNIVFATIEAADDKGGIFRSSDRGMTWERRNPYDSTAMYYARIVADPGNKDRIYEMGVFIQVSDDGGRTMRRLRTNNTHVDYHEIWIDPNDTDYYLVGCDGGIYESLDRAETWRHIMNLPVSQFYDVAVDNNAPFYNVYGGTQDNFSVGGPSRTRSQAGIVNSDWFVTNGGDGFRSQVDPDDPNTIYSESQYGGLVRFDRRTGERVGIQPAPGKGVPPYRWNWDSPILVSPHSHTRLFFAANILFQSDDRGNTWKAISPDLSRQLDRDKLPVFGKIWGPDAVAKNASTSFYGNIVALAESPKKDGLIYVGTDDGLIQITENGGENWTKYETFPGVPDRTYVSRLLASAHNEGTVYAAFENHKNADFKPYLLKSTDSGKTWTSIASNLPENGPVLAIAEDHVNPNLLFVGTEFGLWFTLDGGGKWTQLKGGLPTIAVRDLAVQRKMDDLVLATFGRGFWVLDDYTPLRQVKAEALTAEAATFPVRNALMYVQASPLGGRGQAFLGNSYYVADNPPYGATFTYHLKDSYKSKKETRQEKEKEANKKNQPIVYPTKDELRAEAESEAPSVYFAIADESGTPIRRINARNNKGLNRITWDLRYASPILPPERASEGDEDDPFPGPSPAPMVMPGKYTATLYKKVEGNVTQLAPPQTFEVVVPEQSGMTPADRAQLTEFQRKLTQLYRAASGTLNTANELSRRIASIKRALNETPAAYGKLYKTADQLEERNRLILRALRGDVTLARRNENVPPAVLDRIQDTMGDQRMSSAAPTQIARDAYTIASQELSEQLATVRKLADDLVALEKEMEAAGAPWTPGRIPDWQEK